MFTNVEDLNSKNCMVQRLRYVKSITRRPKEANVGIAGTDIVIEVSIHAGPRKRKRWNGVKNEEKWGSKENCWGYCGDLHHKVFIKDERLFHIVKSEIREFKNPWLLKHIMTNVFKDQK